MKTILEELIQYRNVLKEVDTRLVAGKKLRRGDIVEFHPRVFEPPFTPYYDAYKNHLFVVMAISQDRHIELKCLDNSSIIVDGLVEEEDLIPSHDKGVDFKRIYW